MSEEQPVHVAEVTTYDNGGAATTTTRFIQAANKKTVREHILKVISIRKATPADLMKAVRGEVKVESITLPTA